MSVATPSHTIASLLVIVCTGTGFNVTTKFSVAGFTQLSGLGPVTVNTYVTVSMLLPVFTNTSVIVPLPLALLPVTFVTGALVQLYTAPVTSLVGVKFTPEPLQIVLAYGVLVKVGVGSTVTVVDVLLVAHPLPLTVKV